MPSSKKMTTSRSSRKRSIATICLVVATVAGGVSTSDAFALRGPPKSTPLTATSSTMPAPTSHVTRADPLDPRGAAPISPSSSSSVIVDDDSDTQLFRGLFSSGASPQPTSTSSSTTTKSSATTTTTVRKPRASPFLTNRQRPSKLEQHIKSHADWTELMEQSNSNDDNKITVVKFHAAWCKSCQRMNHQWEGKILRKYSDNDKFQFASVEFGRNKKLCESLGIAKLPTVRYYYQGEVISSLSGGAKKMPQYKKAFEQYETATTAELQFEAQMQSQKAAFEQAMAEVADDDAATTQQQKQKQKLLASSLSA